MAGGCGSEYLEAVPSVLPYTTPWNHCVLTRRTGGRRIGTAYSAARCGTGA